MARCGRICNPAEMSRVWSRLATACKLYALAVACTACAKTPPDAAPPRTTSHTPTASPPPPTAAQAAASIAPATPPSLPNLRSLTVASGKATAKSPYGMVASVEPAASRAGVAMLEAGGNAVDAAVAVGYALAVTHPSAGNVGGGGFMLVKMAGQPTVALDFREQAPRAVTRVAFRDMIARRGRGTTASGIPGSVAGFNYALQRWGTLPRADVLQPAVRLAAEGHDLGERQALVLQWAWPQLSKDPEAKRIFGRAGRPLRQGERLKQPDLSRTLSAIAESGDTGFYAGAFAQAYVRLTASSAVPISANELTQYQARPRPPLHTTYRNLLVETASPPSAGAVAVVQMLAMLEQERAWTLPLDSAASLHLFAEVAKRAHAERRFAVVDPASVHDYDVQLRLERWRDPSTWLEAFPIGKRSTPAAALHPLYEAAMQELNNTTHFSVADRHGNVVSCTTTLSAGFGAKYVVPGTGVVMNNSLGAFGTVGHDVLRPERRMTSSMAPTLVSDSAGPVLILGSPGGDTIPNTVVQVLRNVVDYKMALDRAVEHPRIHHGFVPDAIRSERLRPIDPVTRNQLRQLGHAFAQPSRTIGDANNIARTAIGWEGMADPREGGLALGPGR